MLVSSLLVFYLYHLPPHPTSFTASSSPNCTLKSNNILMDYLSSIQNTAVIAPILGLVRILCFYVESRSNEILYFWIIAEVMSWIILPGVTNTHFFKSILSNVMLSQSSFCVIVEQSCTYE